MKKDFSIWAVVMAFLLLLTRTAIAVPPPVSLSGSLTWTNSSGTLIPVIPNINVRLQSITVNLMTNNSIIGPGFVAVDTNGGFYLGTFGSGLTFNPVTGLLTSSGAGGTNGNFVNVGTNAVAVTNGALVTVSGVTDTNAVLGLLGGVTNGAITVLSNYVLTVSQNATNDDILFGSNGTNQSWRIGANATNDDFLLGANITNGAINNLTNYANTLSQNATNDDFLMGANVTNGAINNLSNYVFTISQNATNQSFLIGANVTNGAINNLSNYVFTLSQNATNDDILFGGNATNNDQLFGANGTNQSWKIGLNATNDDILLGINLTNGAINNLSNYVFTLSQNATNQSFLIGANVTNGAINNLSNYVFTLSQNATNQSLLIGANDTNQSWKIGLNATNDDFLLGANITNGAINNLSNYVFTLSQNATNQSLLIGANVTNGGLLQLTNYINTLSQNATNQSLLIGANGTNQSLLIGLNATNEALLIGANATNNDLVITSTNGILIQTNGQVITVGANIGAFDGSIVVTTNAGRILLQANVNALGAIASINGIGTNTSIRQSFLATNAYYGDFLFFDPTNHAFGFIQTNGCMTVWTNGTRYEAGTNTDFVVNFDVTGWLNLQGPETNSTLTGPGVVAADANGSRSIVSYSVLQTPFLQTINGAGFGLTNLSKLSVGTDANRGLMVVDSKGNITVYNTNGVCWQAYDLNTNVFFSVNGTNQGVTVRGLFQMPTNGLPIGLTSDPGAGNLYASNAVSALTVTNRGFTAIGVMTNDANGKTYTTPTLPSTLLGSGWAVVAGNSGNVNVPVNSSAWYHPFNTATNITTSDASGITRMIIPANCTLANFYAIASSNPGAVANTVNWYTNGVLMETLTLNNVTSANDTTHSYPVLGGWELGVKVVSASSGTAVKWSWANLCK